MTKILCKAASLFVFSTDQHIVDDSRKKKVLSGVSHREGDHLADFNTFNEPKESKGKRVTILTFL